MVGLDTSMPEGSTDPDRILCVGNVAQTPQAGYIRITSASLRFGRSSYGETSAAHGANLPPVLRRHQVVGTVPPSITYSVPVMDAARGDARNATSSATSRGRAGRPIGIPPSDAMSILRALS